MSPVSRGRKGKNKNKTAKSARRPAALDRFSAPDTCDCPACSGEDVDPGRLIDEVLTGAADLVGSADPLEAEIAGSVFVSIGALAGEEFTEALVDAFIPEFEARACPEAVAMLLAIGSVAPDPVGKGRIGGRRPARRGWSSPARVGGRAGSAGHHRRMLAPERPGRDRVDAGLLVSPSRALPRGRGERGSPRLRGGYGYSSARGRPVAAGSGNDAVAGPGRRG